jgi:hypothetical protein
MRRAVGIARRFARTVAAVAMAAIGLDAVVS